VEDHLFPLVEGVEAFHPLVGEGVELEVGALQMEEEEVL